MDQPKKVLVLDAADDIHDALIESCVARFSFVKITPQPGFLAQVAASLPRIHLVSSNAVDPSIIQLCGELRNSLSSHRSYLILCVPEAATQDMPNLLLAQPDDVLLKPFTAAQLELRLLLADFRLQQLARLEEERNFYRQAVLQEEQLSRKLLEQQQNLKGNLVDTVKRNQQLKTVHKTLKRQAAFDVLTGLLNRRSLNDRLELEVNRSHARAKPLCGMMIDIDFFKSINDSWGHLAGDMVLERLGGILHKHLRRNDHAGRYGGEEFFIILPDTDLDDCLMIANRIRSTIEDTVYFWEGERFSVTVSIGVAKLEPGEALASWINNSDTALYRAKDSGRNRTCFMLDGRLLDYPSKPEATSAHR